ncbi:hypothetical protein HK096_011583, partial [Nowakowskiella sp. JEL0078]
MILDEEPPRPLFDKEDLYSRYFDVDITTLSQLKSFGGSQNSTTILDNVFRPLKLDKDRVEFVYAGFEDFGFRDYPYRYSNSSTSDDRVARRCEDPSLPDNLRGRVGYIPGCRKWYRDAKNSTVRSSEGLFGPVVVGSPYISTATDRVTITVSQAMYNGDNLLGVVGIDMDLMKFLASFTKHSKVLSN